MKFIANLVSVVFNPLLITTYLFWVLTLVYPEVYWPYNSKSFVWLWCIYSIGTLLMPSLSILYFKFSGYITNINLENRKERITPFYFITFWYFISAYLLISKISIGWHMSIIMCAITIMISALTLITHWYKISVHGAGIWGAAGFLAAILVKGNQSDALWPLILTILVAGIVGTCRLYLHVHTLKEVVLGSLLGFGICFTSLALMW